MSENTNWAGAPPYGFEGKPKTCHWCGRKLSRNKFIDDTIDKPYPENLVPHKYLGYYADGHFCGLRCGYRYGCAEADARLDRQT